MNFKNIKRISLFIFIFASSGSFAQYKYDVGLKVSTLDEERLQLEQRFHLRSPYTLVATYAVGGQSYSSYNSTTDIYDSTISTYSKMNSSKFNTLKFGVQRKINGLASDVFYAGLNVGIGHQGQRNFTGNATYSYDTLPSEPMYYQGGENVELISSNSNEQRYDLLHAQLGVTFGMDIPLTKRLLVNAEVAVSGGVSTYLGYQNVSFFNFRSSVSGGLRYQFGKLAE